VGEPGVDHERDRQEGRQHVGDQQHPPPLDGVGDRAAEDRQHEQRHQLAQRDQPNGQRVAGHLVHLEGHGHERDVAAELRHGLPGEQQAKVLRFPHRRQVDRVPPDPGQDPRLAKVRRERRRQRRLVVRRLRRAAGRRRVFVIAHDGRPR
jgi:hypothetical protein